MLIIFFGFLVMIYLGLRFHVHKKRDHDHFSTKVRGFVVQYLTTYIFGRQLYILPIVSVLDNFAFLGIIKY